ncbi:MAG: hypothetical protein LKE46_02840 [Clostridium sp.]|jgi:hypothetical protein|uniref:hypothetical protein n=1 Tax=Clostridium sp. TaxID=1506 RepID=UPI0025BF52DC|nr:hypothetical protein [Clostridium sp.]MCH3963185.1 hypothetical protein [Clostridium sp.]MCI1716352.1 hypothetical protein [Clostridium sp.]MCI1800692.1 hypothetical protein [Clostridium sp.]MCI1814653.1 hypothetical protein [Clostridium sp.]MCI1871563.1 hypothetical protein [Clostridium sp.]
MNGIDELFSRLMRRHDMRKRNRILNLDNEIKVLNKKLRIQDERYNKILKTDKYVREKNIKIEQKYKELLKILKSRGIIFEITSQNINVREWENLYIKLIDGRYKIINKNGELIYQIKDKYYNSINHIINNYKYSIVTIRKDNYIVKLQLRII